MSAEKKHIDFTGLDIENYHKGKLSPKERNAMEKAALDDPFLADAIEGYNQAGVNASADLEDLRQRLEERLQDKKVIPLPSSRGTYYSMMRVAVMIVLIAGAGFLVYRFAFNNDKSKPVAQLDKKIEPSQNNVDSLKPVSPESGMVSTEKSKSENERLKVESVKPKPVIKFEHVLAGGGAKKPDTVTLNSSSNIANNFSTSPNSSTPAPVNGEVSRKNSELLNKPISDFKKSVKDDEIAKRPDQPKTDKDVKEVLEEKRERSGLYQKTASGSVMLDSVQFYNNRSYNAFRGRITDANNNPVPFANVTNTRDNVGTYSDAQGYFNLASPDSTLNVQIRSVGFDDNNARLINRAASNQVVMQEDRSLNARVIDPTYRNANRAFVPNVKAEEPEPADGWANYDTYLINNLKVPDDIKDKQITGAVELSFEVNKDGEPVNIKVEKSLCSKCDKEAIRLIKDGPKWKRNAKNGRTNVTIPF